MRLLLVSGEFPERVGGVGDHTLRLGESLAGRGFDVHVLTSADAAIAKGGPLHVRPTIASWGLRGAATFARECRAVDPDVVLFQYVPHLYMRRGLPVQLLAYFMALQYLVRAPVVLVCHEPFNFLEAPAKYRLLAFLQRRLLEALASLSRFVVVTTEARLRAVARCRVAKEKVRLIRVGASIPEPPATPKEENVESRRRENAPVFRVAMFGTLELERRRPDVVCAALERVARAHPDRAFELVLIGPIPESTARFLDDTRRRALPFALRATGKLPIDAVAGVLSECDAAFSFDTHQLGGVSTCSTSCAAILATGVPLVGNQGPDTDGIFEDGANVIFCAIDAGEAAAVLERLLDQPALRRKLSAGGRELFQRELRWGRIAEKFETLIEETLPLRGKARSGLSRQPVGH